MAKHCDGKARPEKRISGNKNCISQHRIHCHETQTAVIPTIDLAVEVANWQTRKKSTIFLEKGQKCNEKGKILNEKGQFQPKKGHFSSCLWWRHLPPMPPSL